MNIGLYLCRCGTALDARLDVAALHTSVASEHGEVRVRELALACSEAGLQELLDDVRDHGIERVVVAACSPRDLEGKLRTALQRAGHNPYLLQVANIREQAAWSSGSPGEALHKAASAVRAALRRVAQQHPLQQRQLDVNPAVLVIGAGPAGLQAALTLARAGRPVVVVEREPFVGGMPVLLDKLHPTLECGACLISPLLQEVLHGPLAERIELLTLAEVEQVAGFLGNFEVTLRQRARRVTQACIGCGECLAPCPVTLPDGRNGGLSMRKAVLLPPGALPAHAVVDATVCLACRGKACDACVRACPVPGAFDFAAQPRTLVRGVGAVVVAVGSRLYPAERLPALGHGRVPQVITSLELERRLAPDGPTAGALQRPGQRPVRRVALVHCAGALDPAHVPYCSQGCCSDALKYARRLLNQYPEVRVTQLYRELVLPGPGALEQLTRLRGDLRWHGRRYAGAPGLHIEARRGAAHLTGTGEQGEPFALRADLVVLCLPAVAPDSAAALAAALELERDEHGFLVTTPMAGEGLRSGTRGITAVGGCAGPTSVAGALAQGIAAAGQVLAQLVVGQRLELEPAVAEVDAGRCSGCQMCVRACPFHALEPVTDERGAVPPVHRVRVREVLCRGCGTCAAACPARAITAHHFTTAELLAEVEGLLA